jgi:hypothetical protein
MNWQDNRQERIFTWDNPLMDKSERLDRVIELIHLYYGRKLWDLRGRRPLEVHEHLLRTPEDQRHLELQNAFQLYVEEVADVIRETTREYRETAGRFAGDENDDVVSLYREQVANACLRHREACPSMVIWCLR